MRAAPAIFLTLMGVHVLWAFWLNRSRASAGDGMRLLMPLWPFYVIFLSGAKIRSRAMRAAAVLQALLFAAALWLAVGNGAWGRQLLSPVWIGAGLLAGHLIFGASVLATHRSVRQATGHLVKLGPLWDYLADNPRVLMQFASVSVAEETIYRAALQPLAVEWFGPVFGVLGVALVFAAVHEHFFRNTLQQSGEFLAFALLLGVLYYWTGSLILVMVVHAVRNIEIAFMERQARVEEAGDEAAADRELLFEEGRMAQALIVAPGCGMATACVEISLEPADQRVPQPVQA